MVCAFLLAVSFASNLSRAGHCRCTCALPWHQRDGNASIPAGRV